MYFGIISMEEVIFGLSSLIQSGLTLLLTAD